jgi:gamma-glutamyltranspeptidase/glutathione hydrolase
MLLKDGRPVLVAGAPGGSVIISATLQAILNVIDFGMSPVEAVTVPRIHCEGKGIQAEATIQGRVVAELRAMGHKVVHSPHSFEPMMSRAHVISTLGGKMRGGADPRARRCGRGLRVVTHDGSVPMAAGEALHAQMPD